MYRHRLDQRGGVIMVARGVRFGRVTKCCRWWDALLRRCRLFFFFFFQAEDGIRDLTVTGVQTCALPIFSEVLDFAEVLLNRDDIDAKADAFIDFLSDRVLNKEFDDGFGGGHRVQTFADLDGLFRAIFDGLELSGRSDMWRTHHIATIRKVRNRLSNISTRCNGLVTDDGPSRDLPSGGFEARSVYVVDVANVDPLGQDLVFARAVSKLREHL